MVKNQVGKIEIFKDISAEQIDEVYTWLQCRDYPQNSDIIREGCQSHGLHMLLGGTVSIIKKCAPRKVRLTEITAPSFFGEIGLLNKRARTATVRAKTNVIIAYLPGMLFANKLAENNIAALRICQNLARLLAERLADTTELLAQTAVLSMNPPRGSLPQWMRSEQDSGVIGLSRAGAAARLGR
jgi:CRP-like cAMP-binding protein